MSAIQKRKTFLVQGYRKKMNLRSALIALGVTPGEQITRDDIERAHKIFRSAKGCSVEVNNLWNVIKRYQCCVCGGVKLRESSNTCSLVCARKMNAGERNKSPRAPSFSDAQILSAIAQTGQSGKAAAKLIGMSPAHFSVRFCGIVRGTKPISTQDGVTNTYERVIAE